MIEIIKKLLCFSIFSAATTAASLNPNKYSLPIISALVNQYRAKSTAHYSLSELRKIHKKKQLLLSNFMATQFDSTAHPDKKLTTSYLKLQQKLNFSEVIPLFYCNNRIPAKAVYLYEIKAIVTFIYFELSSFSQQMGTLLHEFRHVQQYSNPNFKFPCDALQSKKDFGLSKNQLEELDADLFVAKTMECPTCLQIYQSTLQKRRDREGYASKKDFAPFIEQATTHCKAHAHHDLTKLDKAIAHDNFKKIIKFDNEISTLAGRMPPFF